MRFIQVCTRWAILFFCLCPLWLEAQEEAEDTLKNRYEGDLRPNKNIVETGIGFIF
jgi:hypothetical protein